MGIHKVSLAENRTLAINLPDAWLTSEWEGVKAVFYQQPQAGLFAPNITVVSNPVEITPTLQQLRDQLVATYKTSLGYKLLGVEMITFLDNPGVRVESVVIAPNGLRIVQTVRAGVMKISETETLQIEIAGSCTQKQASEYLPEMRSSLRFAKILDDGSNIKYSSPKISTTPQLIAELQSDAPKRFPSPKRLAQLPPLKISSATAINHQRIN